MRFHQLAALASLAAPSAMAKDSSSDSSSEEIHLQWAICDADPQTVLAKLGYNAQDPPYKQFPIAYYDTNPPSHTSQGVMFRTKVKKVHHHPRPLSLVKVRFEGESIPEEKEVPGADECVWDRYGEHVYYTCGQPQFLDEGGKSIMSNSRSSRRRRSTSSKKDDHRYEDLLPTEGLWSDEQIGFTEQFRDVAWEDLEAYGPFQNPKWKVKVAGRKGKFDSVIAKGDSFGVAHLMEIEVPAEKEGSDEVYADIDSVLRDAGVVLCDEQMGKTGRLFEAMGLGPSSSDSEDEL